VNKITVTVAAAAPSSRSLLVAQSVCEHVSVSQWFVESTARRIL